LILFLIAILGSPTIRAQERPYGSGWNGWLNIDQRTCMDRAQRALPAAGFTVLETPAWYVHGAADPIAVNITCVADDDTPNLVSARAARVFVSINVLGPRAILQRLASARDFLGEFMRRESTTAGPPPVAQPPAPPSAAPGPVAGGGDLLGSWQACGRVVQFTAEGGEIVGRYTVVGNLAGVFAPAEAGYRLKPLGSGRYQGYVLWKWGDGRTEWRPNTITVSGNQLNDSGSDSCGATMTRVSGSPATANPGVAQPPGGGPVSSPPGRPAGASSSSRSRAARSSDATP
jgi:hypothetical protein